MKLSEKKLFLLDMDGTLYLGDEIFPGTLPFLDCLKRIGARPAYLTNNSSKSTEDYVAKLASLGIASCEDDFVTSAYATAYYLKQHYTPDRRFYICGTESLRNYFKSEGFCVTDEPQQGAVLVIGYDTEITYKKLTDCCTLLYAGADYIATHPDYVCPAPGGSVPDCGCLIETLKITTGREPYVVGKPRPDMVRFAMDKFGVTAEETVLIGDRLYTDIACGVNAGIDTILVLSGESTRQDILEQHIYPTFVKEDIAAVTRGIYEELSQGGETR